MAEGRSVPGVAHLGEDGLIQQASRLAAFGLRVAQPRKNLKGEAWCPAKPLGEDGQSRRFSRSSMKLATPSRKSLSQLSRS
jgi:hypothetical protein